MKQEKFFLTICKIISVSESFEIYLDAVMLLLLAIILSFFGPLLKFEKSSEKKNGINEFTDHTNKRVHERSTGSRNCKISCMC